MIQIQSSYPYISICMRKPRRCRVSRQGSSLDQFKMFWSGQTGISGKIAALGLPFAKRAQINWPLNWATQTLPITHQIKGLTAGAIFGYIESQQRFPRFLAFESGCFHRGSSDNSPTQQGFHKPLSKKPGKGLGLFPKHCV